MKASAVRHTRRTFSVTYFLALNGGHYVVSFGIENTGSVVTFDLAEVATLANGFHFISTTSVNYSTSNGGVGIASMENGHVVSRIDANSLARYANYGGIATLMFHEIGHWVTSSVQFRSSQYQQFLSGYSGPVGDAQIAVWSKSQYFWLAESYANNVSRAVTTALQLPLYARMQGEYTFSGTANGQSPTTPPNPLPFPMFVQ